MISILIWYLIVSIIGWLAWPLAFSLLPSLPDRGYTLSRALGLLISSYMFWLLASLGLLANTPGGMLLAILIMAGLSIAAYNHRHAITASQAPASLLTWLRAHRSVAITAELLFLLAFIAWAVVRAYNPELIGTEKPMELAFLNGVRSSHTFPPRDPWLSGYAISYYYLGYVIIAMLADLSGVVSGVAFNLGIALLFALTLLGSYGLVYNLIAVRHVSITGKPSSLPSRLALLGPLFIGLIGNLEGFFELLRALNPTFVPPTFWSWLDIEDINQPVSGLLWPPATWRHWWWWRASRVIHDRDIVGASIGLQPIDEFPMFSFLLGDMHPHVLALPFVLLALALAFNIAAQQERLSRSQIALYVVVFGGIAFLNISDWPIYAFILLGALVLHQVRQEGLLNLRSVLPPLATGGVILVLGWLAYLPWHLSFSSQVGGILPNVLFPTRLHQLLVMFGPFLFILAWFLIDHAARHRTHLNWPSGLVLSLGLLITLATLSLVLGLFIIHLDAGARNFFLYSAGLDPTGQTEEQLLSLVPMAIRAALRHRLTHPLTPLFLTGLLALTLACLLPRQPKRESTTSFPSPTDVYDAPTGFVLLLTLTGLLLCLGPEFLYIRDNFGQRLNTIFKFYYAAWLLFGTAASYAIYTLTTRRRLALAAPFAVSVIALALAGLIYPILAIPSKIGLQGNLADLPTPTLDGTAYMQSRFPADYNAIRWLQENAEPGAVILEAVGGPYSDFGRVSAMTGLPTVIGWANHERQWRGEKFDRLAGSREADVAEIYNTQNMTRAQELLERYDVTYIFVGTLERQQTTPIGLQKFDRSLTAVFRDGPVVIYRADWPLIEEVP